MTNLIFLSRYAEESVSPIRIHSMTLQIMATFLSAMNMNHARWRAGKSRKMAHADELSRSRFLQPIINSSSTTTFCRLFGVSSGVNLSRCHFGQWSN